MNVSGESSYILYTQKIYNSSTLSHESEEGNRTRNRKQKV